MTHSVSAARVRPGKGGQDMLVGVNQRWGLCRACGLGSHECRRTCPVRCVLADLSNKLRHGDPVSLAASAVKLLDVFCRFGLRASNSSWSVLDIAERGGALYREPYIHRATKCLGVGGLANEANGELQQHDEGSEREQPRLTMGVRVDL